MEPMPQSPAATDLPTRSRQALLAPALFGLGVLVAYRALASLEAPPASVEGVEGWFFAPSGNSPYLIFGVTALVIFTRAQALQRTTGNPPLRAAALALLPSLGLGIWAHYTQATDLLIPSLSLLGLGLAGLLGGTPAFRLALLPSLFLLLAIPLPAVFVNQVIFPLQLASAEINHALLNLIGIPSTVSGDQIRTPGHVFQVIETCSGLRSIDTLLMASVLYAHLSYRSRLQSFLLIATSPLIAFGLNQVRILSIILNPMSQFAGVHTLQGLVMIVCGVLTIAGLDKLLSRWLPRDARGPAELERQSDASRATSGLRLGLAAVAVAVLFASSLWLPTWSPDRSRAHLSLPAPPQGWVVVGAQLDDTFFGSVKFSENLFRSYLRGDDGVRVLVGSTRYAERGSHVLSQKSSILNSGWKVEDESSASLPSGTVVDTYRIGAYDNERLVYRWYIGVETPGRELFRTYFALDRGPGARAGRPIVVSLITDISRRTGGVPGAEARLREIGDFVDRSLTDWNVRDMKAHAPSSAG